MLGIRNTDEVKALEGVSSFCVVFTVFEYGQKMDLGYVEGNHINFDTKILVT